MCGHGTISTITIAIEEGLIRPEFPALYGWKHHKKLVNIEYKQDGHKVAIETNQCAGLPSRGRITASMVFRELEIDICVWR
jgi:proline racemase